MILIGVDALRTPMSYFLDVHVHVHVCMCMNQAFAKANTPEAAEHKLAITLTISSPLTPTLTPTLTQPLRDHTTYYYSQAPGGGGAG